MNKSKRNLHFLMLILFTIGLGKESFSQLQLSFYDSVTIVQNTDTLFNAWAGGMNCPQFSEIDLNGDEIKDLVTFERNFYGSVKTYINEGTPGAVSYKWSPEYQSGFPEMRNWMLLRDFNCDGKEDIFTSVPAGIAVYRNDSEPGSTIQFTKVTSLLQTIGLDGQTPLYVSPPDIPSITDIDNDGDLDILSFNVLGSTIEYHKNLSIENYGNCNELEFELKNACWGYFSEDGTNNTVTLFDTCEVNVDDPEKSNRHAGSTVLALDLNGDNVKEILLGDISYRNMVMLTNGGTSTAASMIDSDTTFPSNSTTIDLSVFPAAYYLDVNNDNTLDLIVAPNNPNTSQNKDNIWLYKNDGNNTIPDFSYQQNNFLQNGMIDVGEGSYPVFFDENTDGLMDIIVGNFGYYIESGTYSSQLLLLRNTGTLSNPTFELINEDYNNLSELGFNGIYPSFGDMDNDGDKDMIIGDEDGNLHYFRNDGGAGNPADFTLSQPNYKGIDIGQSAKPQIIDVNRDGKNDLLIGERSGTINYYENIGSQESADFTSNPTNDFFGQIDVMPECCTGFSAPNMLEDSVGNYMLYVGSEQGNLYLFNEIEGQLEDAFNLIDSLYLYGNNISINGTDLNNDEKTEFVMGQFAGGISLLKDGKPPSLGINDFKQNEIGINVYPNPAIDYIFVSLISFTELKSFDAFIFNSYGQQLAAYHNLNSSRKNLLDLGNIKKGIYFLRIITDKGFASKKIIIQ
jgi:hypothetical protein